MKISYLGHSCFCFSGEFSVCIDPFDRIGYSMGRKRVKYALSTHSHYDHNAFFLIDCEKAIASESDAVGTPFRAIKTFHDEKHGELRGENSVYVFELEGIKICHLGDIGEPFSDKIKQKIGKIDLLLLPVGGNYTIDAVGACEYVQGLKPKAVIPMHYKTERSNIDICGKGEFLSLIDKFARIEKKPSDFELGAEDLNGGLIVFDLQDCAF